MAKQTRETLSSLRAELTNEKRLRACDARDYDDMLRSSRRESAEACAAIRGAHAELVNAGKHFAHLQTSLALLNQVSEQAGRCAAHFAAAYAPLEPITKAG